MQAIIGAGAQNSRALFNLNKAAKLAEAAVLLPSTVMKAYDWGSLWGGPIGGAAMGAIAFASQMAQMQAIKAAEFGGGINGAAPSAGGVPNTALPGQSANPNSVGATPGSQTQMSQTQVSITVTALNPADITDATLVNIANRIAPAIQQNFNRGGGNMQVFA